MSEATRLLRAMRDGDDRASSALLPLVYDELRRLARARMDQERPGHTLQPTALVHEAYLRLIDGEPQSSWDGRGHFFAAAAEAMRRILIEHARRKQALKFGGGRQRLEADDDNLPPIASPCEHIEDLLTLNDALDRLTREDPAKAELVKLVYFAGLSVEEAADALGIARTSAYRQWNFAKAWLFDAMTDGTTGGTDRG
jgi:RNA polymerase sigma factor (TIGR02999 family)